MSNRELAGMVATTTVICLISGMLLSFVHSCTEEPIRRAKEASRMEALMQVLPPSGQPYTLLTTTNQFNETGYETTSAALNGAVQAVVIQVKTKKGYGGDIVIMAGIRNDGTLQGIAILEQKETPGLGANITRRKFLDLFAKRGLSNTDWRVKKDGGDIDEITAATISARAVTEAVKTALEVFEANKAALLKGGE